MDYPVHKDHMNFVWMNGDNNMFIPHSENEHTAAIDPAFFDNSMPQTETIQPSMELNNYMLYNHPKDMDNSNGIWKFQAARGIQNIGICEQGRKINAPTSRKIKPIQNPALKLKTPIAYQRDSDPNMLPIEKEGRAVCINCGAIGVKHSFYTKLRNFCSQACVKATMEKSAIYWSGESQNKDISEELESSSTSVKDEHVFTEMPKIDVSNYLIPAEKSEVKAHQIMEDESESDDSLSFTTYPIEEDLLFPPDKKPCRPIPQTYDWVKDLTNKNDDVVPVQCFRYAPMADCWDDIAVGIKVEVVNTDCDNFSEEFPDYYWVASIVNIAGYKAKLRYEGYESEDSSDFWVNLCSCVVHPVGWCATRGKPLIPPKSIQSKHCDWKDFLVKRLTGARTLPTNFRLKIFESLKSKFRIDLNLELIDKEHISKVKVAKILNIIGKRLELRYYDDEEQVFWVHEDSPLIHPVGWAGRVGHSLCAPDEYCDRTSKGLRDKDDATEDLFPISIPFKSGFQVGMKLEAIDPLNLASICVATIMKVLNDGYLMISIDFYNSTPKDWFCYHCTSASIMPAGFCKAHGINLKPPQNSINPFVWKDYLVNSSSIAAPEHLFDMEIPNHGFKCGMKLECTDLMNPHLICVATVVRTAGRLIEVHFDGWENDFNQWLDCCSSDIFPVGWCELVGYKLEGPITQTIQEHRPSKHKKKKSRKHQRVPAKKVTVPPLIVHTKVPTSCYTSVDVSQKWTADNKITCVRSPVSAAESLGPDQSLPVASVNNATSIKEEDELKRSFLEKDINIWSEKDVSEFLLFNQCATYCDVFLSQNIDGIQLLNLTKEEIIHMTGNKVGPSLKIFDLIQKLKNKTKRKKYL
ncbi:polycomb protein Sfmbt isoform X1 [Acyrthosiphon pisum]|uniref:Polycomb protein Sfmbt n=1 Tax=Acyrthosiphon pisum TaxID=7029 RepID=A0A8R1VZY3_ACYPI|nr:polycomb protein Sfmbt isoform X1 [Acyrthosiphon pisum]|eukprot:XP_001946049.2 PREDICTED: polycomb protein Sfmbt isoform X1 [Acyrthosiphon pisum]